MPTSSNLVFKNSKKVETSFDIYPIDEQNPAHSGTFVGRTAKTVDGRERTVWLVRGDDGRLFGVWGCTSMDAALEGLQQESYQGPVLLEFRDRVVLEGCSQGYKRVDVTYDEG